MEPRLSVSAIILMSNNEMLLTKRKGPPYKDYWCLPGGRVELGETVEEAVIREVLEETGLHVEIKEKLEVIHEEGIVDGKEFNYINTAFLVKPITRNYIKQEEEVTEIDVFDFTHIPELAFRQTEIVKKYLEMHPYG
jgi:8-oxo-dGTP diphosphatase